ncbi:hypothetical protein [Novosphingobium sp. BL-52-GroH]|uniref:hypothetical protein n=1 Tax=Novosphingobium sp. BL-52-GroH TaxID=3349877 RepID=UPI00384C8312
MDLNQLLYHHQLALMRYTANRDEAPAPSRFDLVTHYERRISRLRREMGVTPYRHVHSPGAA